MIRGIERRLRVFNKARLRVRKNRGGRIIKKEKW